ncbi:condensation domain-containing protein, partial [Nocardiopsis sp. CT-R113]
MTVNGKLDHSALPTPDFSAAAHGSRRGPRNPREEVLCSLFAQVLGLDSVGIDDDFFALGGHSLLATQLIGRVRSTLGIDSSVRTIFENPTVAGLNKTLDNDGRHLPALKAIEARSGVLPLSFAQRRLWFLSRLEGPSATYNVPVVTRLDGALDTTALHAALNDVVHRHEALRTVFTEHDGEPSQTVLDPTADLVGLWVTDCATDEVEALVGEHAGHLFDLETDVPLHAHVLRTDPEQHVLVLVVHHIAGDGQSMGPLSRDLGQAYQARLQGQAPDWDPLPVQYVDYTLWQRELLDPHPGDDNAEAPLAVRELDYWRTRLQDLPEELVLPTDRPRPLASSHQGGTVSFTLAPEVFARIRSVARSAGATPFMAVQAAVAVLLSRLGAGNDIPLGTVVAGRDDQALDDLVGFFVNTLVLRTDLSGNPTFTELLTRVRQQDLEDFDHTHVPFEQVVEALSPTRSLARHPLFQTSIGWEHDGGHSEVALPGTASTRIPVGLDVAKFDLAFAFSTTADDGLLVSLEYARDLFDQESAENIGQRLVRVLTAAAADPSTPIGGIDLLDPEETRALLDQGQGPRPAGEPTTLLKLLAERTAQHPDRTALRWDQGTLTYGELDTQAHDLALRLIEHGITPGMDVPVLMHRSHHTVVAFLAILKTGAAYQPLHTDLPEHRLRQLLAPNPCPLVVTDTALDDHPGLSDHHTLTCDRTTTPTSDPQSRPLQTTGPDQLFPVVRALDIAYTMHTSGTTGTPKAIAITHQGVVDLAADPAWNLQPHHRVLFHAPHAFDASTYEIWAPLLNGAQLVIAPP